MLAQHVDHSDQEIKRVRVQTNWNLDLRSKISSINCFIGIMTKVDLSCIINSYVIQFITMNSYTNSMIHWNL